MPRALRVHFGNRKADKKFCLICQVMNSIGGLLKPEYSRKTWLIKSQKSVNKDLGERQKAETVKRGRRTQWHNRAEMEMISMITALLGVAIRLWQPSPWHSSKSKSWWCTWQCWPHNSLNLAPCLLNVCPAAKSLQLAGWASVFRTSPNHFHSFFPQHVGWMLKPKLLRIGFRVIKNCGYRWPADRATATAPLLRAFHSPAGKAGK